MLSLDVIFCLGGSQSWGWVSTDGFICHERGGKYKGMRIFNQQKWDNSNFHVLPKGEELNQPLTTEKLSILFANVRAIGRLTLEEQHLKWCSSESAFMFCPFEYPMDGLELYLRNKLRHCFCLFVFYQRNLVSFTTSWGVGWVSASWVPSSTQDVVYDCCVTDLGFLTWVFLLWEPACAGGVEGLSLPCGVCAWNSWWEARDGIDAGGAPGNGEGSAGSTACQQTGCCCTISAARERF